MASLKFVAMALVVFTCFASKGLAAEDFDHYSLVLMWPAAYCFNSSAGCCLPTTGKPALDFFVTDFQTHSSNGDVVAGCKDSKFFVNTLADLIQDLYAYWTTISCPSSNALPNWKYAWKTSGVCSNLSEHDYFQTALELRTQLDLLTLFKSNGVVPTAENIYSLEFIKNMVEKKVGANVDIECNKNSWNESQFYKIYICYGQDAKTVVSCPQLKISTCEKEVTFGVFSESMLKYVPKNIRMYTD